MKTKPDNTKACVGNNTNQNKNTRKKIKKKKVHVEIDSHVITTKADESNPLVLPSKKEKKVKTKVVPEPEPKQVLSKKKQKQLKQILARKEKSSNREALFQSLAEVQPPKDVMRQIQANSTANKGIKRIWEEEDKKGASKKKLSSIKGAAKKRRKFMAARYPQLQPEPELVVYDPRVVTLSPTPREFIIGPDDESSSDEEKNEAMKGPAEKDTAMEQEGETMDAAKEQEGETMDAAKEQEGETKDAAMEQEGETKDATKEKEGDAEKTKGPPESTPQDKKQAPAPPKINPNYVPVYRTPEIQEARRKLPILGMEQEIMEAINDNPIVIICGETGSGKTTQVPQFLYEAGYAKNGKKIGITEPRRVAASSMAHRVGTEMALPQNEVSYQVRFEGSYSETDTKILFMTDGVLLKKVENDPYLSEFSVIIIDEAHERSIHSDILIGFLAKLVHLKNKGENQAKKLVIMSATLNVEDFISSDHLFPIKPPVINVESRQYPVTNHFNRYTPLDSQYLDMTYDKICKIHRMLPEGGILVFVPGKSEITYLIKKLKSTFPSRAKKPEKKAKEEPKPEEEKPQSPPPATLSKISLDKYSVEPVQDDDDLDIHGFNDIMDNVDDYSAKRVVVEAQKPLYVLPLYAKLPPAKQRLVFKDPPAGCRLCVVATNVAETSITIPNIKYVVDTGKVKQRLYDKVSGISKFRIIWVSKASAQQRSGRAGRTSEGHCYRLYSSAAYQNEFPQHTPPEICLKPLDDVVLQLKNMSVRDVGRFPFPTRPSVENIEAAGERLFRMRAIEPSTNPADTKRILGDISARGQKMAALPVTARFGMLLVISRNSPELLAYVIALVSALGTDELFLNPDEANSEEELNLWNTIKKAWTSDISAKKLGDLSLYLRAVIVSDVLGITPGIARKYGLRLKALKEIQKTRLQIIDVMKKEFEGLEIPSELKLEAPTELISDTLRKLILHSSLPYDQVARLVPNGKKGAYECLQLPGKTVYIHPNSILHKYKMATYVAYQEMVESSQLYMKGITIVEMEWLPQQGRKVDYNSFTFSKPLEDPPPRYDESEDYILCHVRASLGTWGFPPVEIMHTEESERYRWFGYAFLNGDVCPAMKKLQGHYILPPDTMIQSWSHLKDHCNFFYDQLERDKIDTKKKLVQMWTKKDSNYLRSIIELWIDDDGEKILPKIWPPL